MIKNLLYSLFLHFLLLLIIYANFNLKKNEETKTSEIAVSLIALDGTENSNIAKPIKSEAGEEKIKEKPVSKKEKKEAKSEKKSEKNKVKEAPKKAAKAKPAESVKKPVSEEKIQEFSKTQKEEEKQQETTKVKEDKKMNENQDEKQNNETRKEKDLGVKKESNEEQEEQTQNNLKNNAPEMANNIENMDLSAREKFNIQTQLKRCYRRAIEETKLNGNLKVVIKVQISEEGYLDSDLEDLIDMQRYNDPKDTAYKITIDNVRRALDLCSPLRNLPLDKYDIWKEAILEFDESEGN